MSRRQGLHLKLLPAQFVDLALHPCEGVGEPFHRQIVDAFELEVRPDLRPERRLVDVRQLRPCVDEGTERLAVGGGGRCGEGDGLFGGHTVAVLLDDVEHPPAERLRYRSAGEHGEEVAAAQGEDAGTDGQIDRVEVFNHLRHIFGEFIGITFIDAPNRIFILVTKRAGKF